MDKGFLCSTDRSAWLRSPLVEWFAYLIGVVLVCQWFSPTQMLVTFEGESLKEEDVVIRDPSGRVVRLDLPEKVVLVANHQV